MADFDSQALPVQVKVLEGILSATQLQDGQPPGVVQLVGRQLPFRGVKFGRRMRVKTVFYPGNPNGTQQTIGSTLKPTTFNGEWPDRYLGDGQGSALAETFDSICAAGASVEVSWGGNLTGTTEAPSLSGTPIVRVGIITEFEVTYDRFQDPQWSMECEWRSKGGASAPSISATPKINPREGFSNVVDGLQLATATLQAVQAGPQLRLGLPSAATDALNRAFEAVTATVDTISQATGAVTSTIVIPEQAAQQLIGACKNGIDALHVMTTTILGIKLTTLEVRDSALDIIRTRDQFFTILSSSDAAGEVCVDAANGVLVNVEPDVIAEVRAPAGTDLRDLAIKFYGDPDMWYAIAAFNGIDGSAVPSPPSGPSDDPARPIRIPRAQPGSSSDLRAQC